MFDINELFSEVSTSINTAENTDAIWKEKLRFEAGKDYIVRLLPYTKEGREGYKKTLYHYIRYSWQDQQGQWKNVISPRTWGEQCPIQDHSKRVKFKGTPEEQADEKERLSYREGAYANVLVLKDPTNPENEGKVKILDMGKKLYMIIKNALDGGLNDEWTEKAREFSGNKDITVDVGRKVYDLSSNGVNLVIRVRKNQFGLNSYETSSFSLSGADLGKSPNELEEILNSCYDVTKIEPQMSFDEVSKLFKETYLNVTPTIDAPPTIVNDKASSKIDDAPPTFASKPATPANEDIDTVGDVDDWFKKMNISSN